MAILMRTGKDRSAMVIISRGLPGIGEFLVRSHNRAIAVPACLADKI
jgi:hypothetical protein